VQKLF